MRKILVVIAYVAGVVLLVATPFFISKPGRFVDVSLRVFSLPSILNELSALKKENSELKGKLFSLESSYLLPADGRYLYGKVFSLYPFNIKNRIYIALGSDNGVKSGQPVMFSKTVLLGQIADVSSNTSEVITIFNSNYSLPVKIGKKGIDGLLQGGVAPEIGLIDKTKQIAVGDEVFTAAKDMPYGLLVGSIKSVKEDPSVAFLKAQISLPYALSDITDVYVIKDASR
jgi:rod shape-determining protein MreC